MKTRLILCILIAALCSGCATSPCGSGTVCVPTPRIVKEPVK